MGGPGESKSMFKELHLKAFRGEKFYRASMRFSKGQKWIE